MTDTESRPFDTQPGQTTMRAWQHAAPLINNSIPQSLKLNPGVALPRPKPNQHVVKISYVSLNPVDYKPAENSLFRRVVIPNPATPGIDFSGTIVTPAPGSNFKEGDKVFGCGVSPFAGGCLADYAVAGTDATLHIPPGLNMEDASTIGVAGLTAWQSIVSHNPKRVFINGGSGGTGCFGIQIAKMHGIEVAVSCSSRNVELCKRLGADHVVDYTKTNIVEDLSKQQKFDHVVDNVMAEIELFKKAHTYTTPDAKYISVAGAPTLKYFNQSMQMKLPAFLGGGKRVAQGMLATPDLNQMKQIAEWIAQGKIEAVIDERFEFADVPKAFEKLKTGRARGKIVVRVAAL